jgi:uncharacterized protein YbjT (DUF2867 family)
MLTGAGPLRNADTSHRFGHLRDRSTVLDGYREVDGRFLLANLHRDAASLAGATANAVEDSADGAGGAAHMYRFDLLGRDACNLGDDGDAYGRVAVLGYVCLVTFVLAI